MKPFNIYQIPCLDDNYAYILHCKETNSCATIDSPDAEVITKTLKANDLELSSILNTHHHYDHINGNLQLKKTWQASIYGYENDKNRITGIDYGLKDKQYIKVGNLNLQVRATPGHTIGHIIFICYDYNFAFVGDTIFSLGCGRLFEGSYQQMLNSLKIISTLNKETLLYPAHEYSLDNCRFAKHIWKSNTLLLTKEKELEELRSKNIPSVPVLLDDELRLNPFLNTDNTSLQKDTSTINELACFSYIRKQKDVF